MKKIIQTFYFSQIYPNRPSVWEGGWGSKKFQEQCSTVKSVYDKAIHQVSFIHKFYYQMLPFMLRYDL